MDWINGYGQTYFKCLINQNCSPLFVKVFNKNILYIKVLNKPIYFKINTN